VVAFLGCRPGKRPAVAWATFFLKGETRFLADFQGRALRNNRFFLSTKTPFRKCSKIISRILFCALLQTAEKKDIGIWFLLCCFFAVVGRNINNEGSVLPPYSKLIAAERAFSEFCTHNSS